MCQLILIIKFLEYPLALNTKGYSRDMVGRTMGNRRDWKKWDAQVYQV